jgi:hypothetical protein
MKSAFGVGLLLLALVHVSPAQNAATSVEAEWLKVGEVTVSLRSQTGSINVNDADHFAAIKLKVIDVSMMIDKLLIFYESGALQEIDVNNGLDESGETEIFDVSAKISIQKISFHYKKVQNPLDEKVQVELYGLRPGSSAEAYRDDTREDQTSDDLRSELEQAAENVEEDVENAREKIDPETDDTQRKQPSALDATDALTDPLLSSKVGPEGQNIYLDKDDKCYYINDEGEKIYVGKNKLRDKLRKD